MRLSRFVLDVGGGGGGGGQRNNRWSMSSVRKSHSNWEIFESPLGEILICYPLGEPKDQGIPSRKTTEIEYR